LLALWQPAGFVTLGLLPLLAWSRLRMARHTLPEVIGGAALGLLAGIVLRLIG
jgi:membrane-associated phospholipid phosphatase